MGVPNIVERDNLIELKVINGKISEKEKVRYNKDGSVRKTRVNNGAGVSTEVYPFTTEEIKAVIETFNKRIETAPDENKRQIAYRNKLLFLVGINLSLRISDMLTLRWNFFLNNDMSFKENYRIQPKKTRKTGKFVTLYFNETVKRAITEYIEKYPIEDMNEFVFKSRKGNGAISEKGAWDVVVGAAKEAGVTHNVGTHSLRKSFGYHVWHNAEDKEHALVLLMTIFNHSSLVSTKKYIGIMNEEVEDVFNELNLGIEFI